MFKPKRALGVLSLLLLAMAFLPVYSEASELPIPPLLDYTTDSEGILHFELTADEGSREFIPGSITETLGYNGAYLGPTIRVRRGNSISIHVKNTLDSPTTVHWHGADVPAESDGGPHQGIEAGGEWQADFEVRQQAATLWYHPHFMGSTAKQVYLGLAGLLIIDDQVSDALDIPDIYGETDIPLILQERRFDRDGKFAYRPAMPDIMHGYFGNALLVNGALEPYKEVPKGPVRLRLLNGSNSSILRLSFDGLDSVQVIASDGGFLEVPVEMEKLILSPGERMEVIADFSRASGRKVKVLAETNGGNRYEAMEFRLEGRKLAAWDVPERLVEASDIPEQESDNTRNFVMQAGMGARMTINGKTMDMNRVDEVVKLGDTEIWTIENMGGMMNQPHNFHVHAVQFRILDINGIEPPAHLAGWKDTVLIWPGDRVRIIARYDSFPGLFMYHCHLLEHEDNGMMGQFLIQ